MKLPLVKTNHPESVNMISFKRISKWTYPPIRGFAWDDINDDMINVSLSNFDVYSINLSIDWQDDNLICFEEDRNFLMSQALRIAALVKLIEFGGAIVPIRINTEYKYDCSSCVYDGNNRIRALQYLEYTHFPAILEGEYKVIKYLIDKKADSNMIYLK